MIMASINEMSPPNELAARYYLIIILLIGVILYALSVTKTPDFSHVRRRVLNAAWFWLIITTQLVHQGSSQSYIISTYTGTGSTTPFTNGARTSATFSRPLRITTDDSQSILYVSDNDNHIIRKIDTNGIVSTIAGQQGVTGSTLTLTNNGDGGPATSTTLRDPDGVCVNGTRLFVGDWTNNWIRSINLNNGIISTLAGHGTSGDVDATGTAAYFNSPEQCIIAFGTTLLFADSGSGKVKAIDINSQVVTTLGTATGLSATAIWIDSNAVVYVGSSGGAVFSRSYSGTGAFTVVAGVLNSNTAVNGVGTTARFGNIFGLAGDTNGNLFITDNTNRIVRKMVTSTNTVSTIAGTGSSGSGGDGGPATSGTFNDLRGICIDGIGNLYVADGTGDRIRLLTLMQPTLTPTRMPTVQPTHPTSQPSSSPSSPSSQPSVNPTCQPSSRPTRQPCFHPTNQPSSSPTSQPSGSPTMQPSRQPSSRPTTQPSMRPSRQPTTQPSSKPSIQPLSFPTMQPTMQPTSKPSRQPSSHPSCQPTSEPSNQPSARPSVQPSSKPSSQPSRTPSLQPSLQPSKRPSSQPSMQPSSHPSTQPTMKPSMQPTSQPSSKPSCQPSGQPSHTPSRQPSSKPTGQPSMTPTNQPSCCPSHQPSGHPSNQPTVQPSSQPSQQPSSHPSMQPSCLPSAQPSIRPSMQPSRQPSSHPSCQPSSIPTEQPSIQPTMQPTGHPSFQPSMQPSKCPSRQPSSLPSSQPSIQPSSKPTVQLSMHPSQQPTSHPSCQPTRQPSQQPTLQPSSYPSCQPSSQPSTQPSCRPSMQPSNYPSTQPSLQPSSQPSNQPSMQPSSQPSNTPSHLPTSQPSTQPSMQPSLIPTNQPSAKPTTQPSLQPTIEPSNQPSNQPTIQPSVQPSSRPSDQPSMQPSSLPSSQPSRQPTMFPSEQPSNMPSRQPSSYPTCLPSSRPSNQPSHSPSSYPSDQPSSIPSTEPSLQPSIQPTSEPTLQPSTKPSNQPSRHPSNQPSVQPSVQPSSYPSTQPSTQPSRAPSRQPSSLPSRQPSNLPSTQPSTQPLGNPTSQPSRQPSVQPSAHPSQQATSGPSCQPFARPSTQPSNQPSNQPSGMPSQQPSTIPSKQPASRPSCQPTSVPSSQPTRQPTSPSAAPTDLYLISRRPSRSPTALPTIAPSTAQPSFAPTVKLVVASEVSQSISVVAQPSSTSQSPSATSIALPAVAVPQASNTVGQTTLSLSVPSTIQGNSSSSLSVQLTVVEYDASVWTQRVAGEDAAFNSSNSNGTLISVTVPVLQSNILTINAIVSSGDSAVSYRPTFIANLSHLAGSSDQSASDYNNAPVVFAHTCTDGLVETILFDCPGNVTQFNLTCFGTAAVQVVRSCPVLRLSCNLVSLADFRITDRTYCEVAETTRLYTICSCGDVISSSSSSRRRRRRLAEDMTSSNSSSSSVTAPSTVSVGVMSQYVASDVGSTVSLSGSLGNSQQVVSDSVLLLSTFGSVWSGVGLVAVVLLWMYYRRKLLDKESTGLPSSDAVRLAVVINADGPETKPASSLEQGRDYLRHIIPSIFESSHSLLRRLGMQLLAHHPVLRLIGILTGNQRKENSPFLILGELLTEFMFVAFLLALLFDLQYPSDDGTCVLFVDEASCLARTSFYSGRSYCVWSAQSAREYSLSVGLFLQQTISLSSSGLRSLSVQSVEPLTLPPDTIRYECLYNTAAPSFTVQVIVYLFTSVVAQVMEIPIRWLIELTARATEAEATARKAVANMAVVEIKPTAVRSSTTKNMSQRRGNIRSLPVLVQPMHTEQQQSVLTAAGNTRKSKVPWYLSRPSDYLQSLRRVLLDQLDHRHYHHHHNHAHHGSSDDDECLRLILHELRLSSDDAAPAKDNDERGRHLAKIWYAAKAFLEYRYRHRRRRHSSSIAFLRRSSIFPVSNDNASIGSDQLEVIAQWLQTKLAEDEQSLSSVLRAASQAEAGLTIMHVFICDLLGRTTNRPASRLFRQVVEREFHVQDSLEEFVKFWQRCLAIILLLAANVFAMYYTLLRGLKQGKAWQKTFLLVLMGQWLSDMLFVRLIEIAVVDCFLPLLIAKEMRYVWVLLDELWQRRIASNGHHHHHSSHHHYVNLSSSPLLSSLRVKNNSDTAASHHIDLAKYLLLSRKCSISFSHLFEAQMILSLHTSLPVSLVDCSVLIPLYYAATSRKEREHFKLFTLKQRLLGTVLTAPYSIQSGTVGSMGSLALTGLLLLWKVASQAMWSSALLLIVPTLALIMAIRYMSKVHHESLTVAPAAEEISQPIAQEDDGKQEAAASSSLLSSLSSFSFSTSNNQEEEEKSSVSTNSDYNTLSFQSSRPSSSLPSVPEGSSSSFSLSIGGDGEIGSISASSSMDYNYDRLHQPILHSIKDNDDNNDASSSLLSSLYSFNLSSSSSSFGDSGRFRLSMDSHSYD